MGGGAGIGGFVSLEASSLLMVSRCKICPVFGLGLGFRVFRVQCIVGFLFRLDVLEFAMY